jgi:predicted RNA binding protein YcfA (HicA-like mRNA interferase family)
MPPRLTVRDVLRLIETNGWRHVATRGGHRPYRHDDKAGRVTVAGKLSDEVSPGTLNSILKQARLKER